MTTEETSLWNSKILAWRQELQTTIIPADIDPATAKNILHKLSVLFDAIRPEYGIILKKYRQTEQYIDLLKAKYLVGANDAERKRNSYLAVENYEGTNGIRHNLFASLRDLEGQKQDLEALLDMIERKNSVCITMSGFLKIESSLR